ncbi:sensor histidine kinase, partial [Paenibacillus sp. TAF58]
LRITSSREIEVEIDQDLNELHMNGDPYKIRQLLIILLDNALKYSQDMVVLKIAVIENTWVTIEVIDQGIGIAESDLPHLFDRFYRTDKARNRKQGGVGLGLAIAEHIVQKHEGTIQLKSCLGLGTSALITLPKTCQ